MHRKVTLLMVLVILLGLLAGCQKKEERELSVFELKFSDEQKEELLSSYQTWTAAATGLKAETETWAEYSDTEESGLTFSGYRYYGTFDGCVVWFRGGNGTLSSTLDVGETHFYHPTASKYWVRRGEEFYTLTEAYEQGVISAEDVAIVAERHAEYNNEVSIKSSERAKSAVESGALALPEEKQREIKSVFLDWLERHLGKVETVADNIVVYAVWNSGDLYALYLDVISWGYAVEDRVVSLKKHSNDGNYSFGFPSSQLLYIYQDNTLYTLEEAWEAGLLTDEHVQSLLKDNTYQH